MSRREKMFVQSDKAARKVVMRRGRLKRRWSARCHGGVEHGYVSGLPASKRVRGRRLEAII